MRKFTPEEDQFLRDNYLTIPAVRISKLLGRCKSGAFQRMNVLGLIVPDDIKRKFSDESRFKTGHNSFNAGKKQADYMTAESIENTKKTRFKKGNLPHNTKADFEISIREDNRGIAIKHIRIGLGKWVAYHRYVFEQHFGKIPAKHIVAFKDGDCMNCDKDNLELITMGENAIRNSGTRELTDTAVARFLATRNKKVDKELKVELLNHPDLIVLKRNQLLLTRAIKEHGKI